MLRRLAVKVFVDWRAQISNAKQQAEPRASRRAENTVSFVVTEVARFLSTHQVADIFVAEMRLYHGWHAGLTRTENRTALAQLIRENSLPGAAGNVSFDWSQPFGDSLLSALPHRLHPRLGIHLPDTLREGFEKGYRIREKMVDAALLCDLLSSTRSSPTDWRIIMAEDDDFVPGAFVSERWGKDAGGRTFLLRKRYQMGHLQLRGLLTPIGP
jgi:hypothetical protein